MNRDDASDILGGFFAPDAGQHRSGHGRNVCHGGYLFHLVELFELIDGLLG